MDLSQIFFEGMIIAAKNIYLRCLIGTEKVQFSFQNLKAKKTSKEVVFLMMHWNKNVCITYQCGNDWARGWENCHWDFF